MESDSLARRGRSLAPRATCSGGGHLVHESARGAKSKIVPPVAQFRNLRPTVFFSRLVKWHLGSGGVSLFPYRDRAFLRSKKAKMAVSWRVGELLRGVPRHDVNDEAGRQFGSGSSNLLPGMYRPRATVELATSEILPSEAVQAPQN